MDLLLVPDDPDELAALHVPVYHIPDSTDTASALINIHRRDCVPMVTAQMRLKERHKFCFLDSAFQANYFITKFLSY